MLSTGHLLLIFLIVFLLFGAKRLPEIAKSFGHAINEFKKGKDEIMDAVNSKPEEKATVAAAAPVAADKPVSTSEEKKNPVS